MLESALDAAELLAQQGIDVAVINQRFVKPLDDALLEKVFDDCKFVVTVEEGALMGGFGSAVLELAGDRGWDARHMRRLGIPDQFIEHAEREELLADLGLSAAGIADKCRELAAVASEVA
ncbi:MAG: transketolase C-terminal domain-containing protein [Pirellulaceae bacterium]